MSKNIPDKIDKISSVWVQKAPFFAEYLLSFSYEENKNINTIGIGFNKNNNYIKCVYNSDFINSLPENELKGVLAHEILHIIFLSHKRGVNKIRDIFNMASDYAINEEIMNTKVEGTNLELPENGLFFKDLKKQGYDGSCIAEEIYMWLENNQSEKDNFDNHDFLNELSEEIESDPELAVKLKATFENAKSRKYGSITGGTVSLIEELTKTKSVPIHMIIAKNIDIFLSGVGVKNSTWKKNNRRGLPIKGVKKNSSRLNIVVDTSGSCFTQQSLSSFFYSIDKLSEEYNVNIIQFDTEIKNVSKYKKNFWKNIKIQGGGGTDIQPVFEYLNSKKENRVPCVIYTDGEFNLNLEYYNIKPLWVLLNQDNMTFKIGKL